MPEPRALRGAPPDEWTIERLVPGGDGFLRLPDGRTAFATGALPGDRIQPLDLEVRRDYVRARRFRLVAAGPDRIEPPCPVAHRCGGCDLMPLERSAQLREKAAVLREALVRTGRFRDLPAISFASAGPELGYRSRLRVHVDEAGRVGLFARGSRTLVEVPGCIVCEPEVERALEVLRELLRQNPGAGAAFAEIEIRAAPAGPRVALRLFPRAPRQRAPRAGQHEFPPAARELAQKLAVEFAVSTAGEPESHPEQRYPLPGGVELVAPPSAFTQVNWTANLALIGAVLEGVAARALKSVCDLYCGAGNFTLALAKAGLQCLGVDRVGSALDAAERAARAQALRVEWIAGQVPAVLDELVHKGRRFELILLDPPRTGAREALGGVVALEPRAIAICSCDPVTLARDLRGLADRGYVLEEVRGFDLFPQTHHVEALAWMRKGP